MNATKEALRRFFRQKRNLFVKENKGTLTDQFYLQYSQVIADLLSHHPLNSQNPSIPKLQINVGAFYPVKNEINCLSIIRNLQKMTSYSFSLPVVPSDGSRVLTFREYKEESGLVPGAFNIPVPSENAPIVYPDALLIPMLCFNQRKYRLGYGGGYYDSTITSLKEKKPDLMTIGIAFSIQESEEIPLEQHDMMLDYILTEDRLLH